MKNVFIIISGGTGIYDPKDPDQHDQTWDNFVTPPLLRSARTALHDAKTEDVHWLVYEPAYTERWTSDLSNKKTAPTQYEHTVSIKTKHKLSNYIDLLKTRAASRGWTYKGISSAAEAIKYINAIKTTKISRLWFFGHASEDLWLSLSHDIRDHEAVSPDRTAVLSIGDIGKINTSSFITQKDASAPHKFFGCNTKNFAEKWARHLKVHAEGSEGKVDYKQIHDTGGRVTLSPGARWHQHNNAGIARLLLWKSGDKVD